MSSNLKLVLFTKIYSVEKVCLRVIDLTMLSTVYFLVWAVYGLNIINLYYTHHPDKGNVNVHLLLDGPLILTKENREEVSVSNLPSSESYMNLLSYFGQSIASLWVEDELISDFYTVNQESYKCNGEIAPTHIIMIFPVHREWIDPKELRIELELHLQKISAKYRDFPSGKMKVLYSNHGCNSVPVLDRRSNSRSVFTQEVMDSGSSNVSSVDVQGHWSEGVTFPRPFVLEDVNSNSLKQNCPYLQPLLLNWENSSIWKTFPVANGSDFSLPENSAILITSKSLNLTGFYGYITIPTGSELIFADENITLNTRGIIVKGQLKIGSPTCRISNSIKITLFGDRPSNPDSVPNWDKGIYVTGTLEMHGQIYAPTWSRLAKTANIGDMIIFIQDMVNWQAGQVIMIATTVLKDSLDYHQNEKRKITKIQRAPHLGVNITAITIDTPLIHQHYGGREYQAEVGLLSRNIIVSGDKAHLNPLVTAKCTGSDHGTSHYPCDAPKGYGGHIFIFNTGIGRASGVELYHMGQTNILGKYPFHFHLLGDNGKNSYFNYGSFHDSFYRCLSIHGTNFSRVSNNVAFNITGHCYFIEDGIEEQNTIEYNFGSLIHFLGSPSPRDYFYSQDLVDVRYSSDLIVPSDITASVFYIPNSNNVFRGNAASGGWSGFAFPNFPKPMHLSRDVVMNAPLSRPLLLFDGNSAHSSGYWWSNAGTLVLKQVLFILVGYSMKLAKISTHQYTILGEAAVDVKRVVLHFSLGEVAELKIDCS
jgi:hypothetical protein